MDLLESSNQSFIIKIWIEETAEEAGDVVWRGHITHVGSGERHYFTVPDDILVFMMPYLRRHGIKFELNHSFPYWWRRWKKFLSQRISPSQEEEVDQR